MDEEDDKPDRQIDSVRLEIGVEVGDLGGNTRWITQREIGKGAFGTVYRVTNKVTKLEAALKAERLSTPSLLKIEREIMDVMQHEATAIHIFDAGIYNEYRYIVMTLCGPDLQKISDLMNNKFSGITIIRVCIRTLLAIKTLHEYAYIHRDLKPCNFAVDYNPKSLHVYLFDYGMGRRYAKKDDENRWHLRRAREPASFRGTLRYCSLNVHKLREQGRVDDLWSWFFMLMEMHLPLPWSSSNNKERVEALKEEHLMPFLEKDPFLRTFIPIVQLLNATGYVDRPDYMKIFEMLHANLQALGGKLSGHMEYDAARIAALVAEQGEAARPKPDQSIMEDEQRAFNYLTSSFGKVVIPGGNEYLLIEGQDFFGNWGKKGQQEERTDENARKKSNHHKKKEQGDALKKEQRQSIAKQKMLGHKTKQPSSGPGLGGAKSEAQSSSGNCKVSINKNPRRSKTKH